VVQLTDQGAKLGKEWQSLLLMKEPIIEVVAGLVDGSITGLVVILSAFIAGLTVKAAAFAAFLTLSSVAITNFQSFFLGGITEGLADMMTLQTLMNYSLSNIPGKERARKVADARQALVYSPAQGHKPFKPSCSSDMRHNLFHGGHNTNNGLLRFNETPEHYPIPRHSCHGYELLSGSLPLQKVQGALEDNTARNGRNRPDPCHCLTASRRHRLSLEVSAVSR
jgi:hypothetical protein